MEVPWWALSPSPVSILFYLLLAFYAMKRLLQVKHYPKWTYVVTFTDALLLVGFVVLLLDACWVLVCAIRFLPEYPGSFFQLAFSFCRDIAGVVFCYLLTSSLFKHRIFTIRQQTPILFVLNLLFLIVWFWAAPSPAYTDWTFAIRNDYGWDVVAASFVMSHVLGKSLVATIFLSCWEA